MRSAPDVIHCRLLERAEHPQYGTSGRIFLFGEEYIFTWFDTGLAAMAARTLALLALLATASPAHGAGADFYSTSTATGVPAQSYLKLTGSCVPAGVGQPGARPACRKASSGFRGNICPCSRPGLGRASLRRPVGTPSSGAVATHIPEPGRLGVWLVVCTFPYQTLLLPRAPTLLRRPPPRTALALCITKRAGGS